MSKTSHDTVLTAAFGSERFHVVQAIAAIDTFDIAVITVPTPLREGAPDLTYVEIASKELPGVLRPGNCVVLESTTYPGTTEDSMVPLLEQHSGLRAGVDFQVGFSPERIDPGNETWTIVTTPKIVSGIDGAVAHRVAGSTPTSSSGSCRLSSPKVAELAKLLENTYRHVNIALVNELAILRPRAGHRHLGGHRRRGHQAVRLHRFTPGPGVGGHCLPIDPSYLSWQVKRQLGHSFRFVELANDVNEHMPDYVARRSLGAQRGRARRSRALACC